MASRNALTTAPHVLTLEIDGEAFASFGVLRREHYPRERNMVPAHITLFHRLPGERSSDIKALLALTAAKHKPFPLVIRGVRETECGVAVFLQAPQLLALREVLVSEWEPWLDNHDLYGFRPHVTIAANVSPSEARRIRDSIASIRLPPVRATGLHLWRYRDGPWESERMFPFR